MQKNVRIFGTSFVNQQILFVRYWWTCLFEVVRFRFGLGRFGQDLCLARAPQEEAQEGCQIYIWHTCGQGISTHNILVPNLLNYLLILTYLLYYWNKSKKKYRINNISNKTIKNFLSFEYFDQTNIIKYLNKKIFKIIT